MNMNWMMSAATESMREFFRRVAHFLPTLLGVLVILLVGWLVAVALKRLLVRLLHPWLDDLAEKLWVSEVLRKGDIKYSVSELFGVFLYWVIMMGTLIAALNALGLTEPAVLLERVLEYVPNVLAGIIMLALGLFFASLISGIVQTAAANAGITQAKGLGQIARMVVITFASVTALEKFFSSMIIQTTFTVIVAAVAFAFALAFGLGCKDIAGKFVGDFIDKVRRR